MKYLFVNFLSKLIFINIFICFPAILQAQNSGYYIDRFDDLFVFEDGITIKAEHQLVKNVQIGKDLMFYQNYLGNFIMYKDGEKQRIAPTQPNLFITQRDMILTDLYGGLAVLSDNTFKALTTRNDLPFSINDSLVAYEDYDDYLNLFYQDEIKEIAGPNVFNFRTSANTVAYIDADQTLYLNHNFNNYEVESSLPVDISFRQLYQNNIEKFGGFWANNATEHNIQGDNIGYWVGNNSVAYINNYEEFIYYKDDSYITLSEYTPLAVFPGYDVIAYITEDEDFYIYENGNNEQISAGNIKTVAVKDNLVVWTDFNQDLYCWYNGQQKKLASFVPSKIKFDLNNLVFTDLDDRLWAFYKGEKVQVSNRQVNDFNIWGNTIIYKYNLNDYGVFWNGENY